MTTALFPGLYGEYDAAVLLAYNDQVTKRLGSDIFALIEGKIIVLRSEMFEGISCKTVFKICDDFSM